MLNTSTITDQPRIEKVCALYVRPHSQEACNADESQSQDHQPNLRKLSKVTRHSAKPPCYKAQTGQRSSIKLKTYLGRHFFDIDRTYENGEGVHSFYTTFGRGIWTNNMSYTVCSSYKHNPDALRNLETLNPAVNSTIKAFFSHFAARAQGQHQYWAYQGRKRQIIVIFWVRKNKLNGSCCPPPHTSTHQPSHSPAWRSCHPCGRFRR